MKYKEIKCNNYNIYLIKTSKFKTINISTVIINDYTKEEITKNKLISEFLINSNNDAKNEVLMSKKYMDLYEPSLFINDYYSDKHDMICSTTFLNEKYTEKGMNKKTIDFYYNIIFNPNLDNDMFESNNFNINKNKLLSWYKMDEEDSSSMAYFSSLSNISDDIPIKIDTRGSLEDLLKIDREKLKKYYFNKLNNSMFNVFVVGDYDDELIDSIKSNLDNKVNDIKYDLNNIFDVTNVKEVNTVIEEKNFNQSIIYLIYKIIGMTKRERYYVLPVLNNILGGSSAKLFNNVREKNSLAYYAYSSISMSNNILYMYAGISKENYDKCSSLMKEQLKEIVDGNITDQELNNSKNSLNSGILSQYDNIGYINNNLKSVVLFNMPSMEELEEGYKTVTKEEIINLSKKIELDVEYLLKGVKE